MAKSKMKGVTSSTRNGVEYWYARVGGQKKYCGKDAKGRELAYAAKSKDVARSYENKEVNAGLKVKRAKFKTVKDICNWYMTLPASQKKKCYERDLVSAQHILGYFGRKPINGIDPIQQQKYRSFREGQGVVSATVDIELKLLSRVYNLALKWKKIPHEVMPGEFVILKDSAPRRPITPKELRTLLGNSNPTFQDVLICGYESAMRVSEICELTAGKVKLNIKHISGQILDYISLGVFDTKNKTQRNIPISPRLKEVLERRVAGLDDNDYVFTNTKSNKYHRFSVTARLRAVCKKSGIPYGDKAMNASGERIGIVFHSLRHARITEWVRAGYSDEIIRMASGHKSLDAYRKYVHLDPSAVMRLVENIQNGTKTEQNLREAPKIGVAH